jgi:hypothetical protein
MHSTMTGNNAELAIRVGKIACAARIVFPQPDISVMYLRIGIRKLNAVRQTINASIGKRYPTARNYADTVVCCVCAV